MVIVVILVVGISVDSGGGWNLGAWGTLRGAARASYRALQGTTGQLQAPFHGHLQALVGTWRHS